MYSFSYHFLPLGFWKEVLMRHMYNVVFTQGGGIIVKLSGSSRSSLSPHFLFLACNSLASKFVENRLEEWD
jgi:hypothetical protein